MNYEVWLHARHPKTLETVATVRIYAHTDRLRAEHVLENAQTDHQPLVLALLQVHPGALVNAEMHYGGGLVTTDDGRVAVLVEALRNTAAFHDRAASDWLAQRGSYYRFDEPGAVKTAREALAQIGITE